MIVYFGFQTSTWLLNYSIYTSFSFRNMYDARAHNMCVHFDGARINESNEYCWIAAVAGVDRFDSVFCHAHESISTVSKSLYESVFLNEKK